MIMRVQSDHYHWRRFSHIESTTTGNGHFLHMYNVSKEARIMQLGE